MVQGSEPARADGAFKRSQIFDDHAQHRNYDQEIVRFRTSSHRLFLGIIIVSVLIFVIIG